MKNIIENFSIESFKDYFYQKIGDFKPSQGGFSSDILNENEDFSDLKVFGEVELSDAKDTLFFACKSDKNLSERSAKKVQYEITKRLMQDKKKDSAIAIFYDEKGDFRFSFVRRNYGEDEKNKQYTSWKRYTYFVSKNQTNRTFLERIESCNFNSLESIQEAFSVERLTKDFYNDLYKWYSWTLTESAGLTFPNDTRTSNDDREKLDEKIIRLITRILFVWFIKHKNLVPEKLFKPEELQEILKDFDKNSAENGNYYNAILQNLFFATLNKEIKDRSFASLKSSRDIKTLYRYDEMFSLSKEEILQLFKPIPFLNGGLFECLDKEMTTDGVQYHLDGFSRNDKKSANGNFTHRAFIPNCIFFGDSDSQNEGLIPILERYNFTIEENSTAETQVALDPELLGNVFENLLGAFNEETRETARKQSGSFYTPREIVDFMVNESLKSYLNPTKEEESFVEILFKEDISESEKEEFQNKELQQKFSKKLKEIKILDPACGSGAFPMGILNRMVELLDKLDEGNSVSHHDLKLHLIEECIYGVDIQSIAVQISKLRFFISLVVEQEKMDFNKENYGVHTLPNLETKFVAANTLIGVKKYQPNLFDGEIEDIKTQLLEIRKNHFYAKNVNQKKTLRDADKELRNELLEILKADGQATSNFYTLFAEWNPYDQNTSSPFFNMEWMFGVSDGFDIVIGNPPYISTKGISIEDKNTLEEQFGFADDTYNHFFFKGNELLKEDGVLCYITPKTFWTTQTKRNLRDLILSNQVNYIFDTANPFESAMVDTCITSFSKNKSKNMKMEFLDGSKNLKEPIKYKIHQQIFVDTQNSVIFKPTEYNLKIHSLYGKKVKELYEKWWDKISTSKNIAKNEKELQTYRNSLKAGDVTLLGCLTEGGQGLATANNGKYIAVRKSTKWADNIIKSRPKKLVEAISKKKIKDDRFPKDGNYVEFLDSLSESEIAILFDELKEKYGRDIFGQGYIYRLVEDSEIADVETLTQEEKENGIDTNKNYYVPYDKGDKDGNRWYLETPFAIAWSKENVGFLKTNSGKKGQGMPVVRNPQYYFKEGFCWTNILNPNARLLKTKLKQKSVNDVGSMSLSSIVNIPNYYFISLLNSDILFDYYREFINVTVNIQINDIRQLPIVIPNEIELEEIKILFEKIIKLKKQNSNDNIDDLEFKINKLVNTLYSI